MTWLDTIFHRLNPALPERPDGEIPLLMGGCVVLCIFAILPFLILEITR